METLPLVILRCILSYCGLRTLLTLRRVSKQFRALSDDVPKKWINLSDLFKPDMVHLSERVAIAGHYAGAELIGFSTGTYDFCENLRSLPWLLSVNCPNLKTLRLSGLMLCQTFMHDLCKYAGSFPNLEEITVYRISPECVVALPALKRINGTVYKDLRIEKVDAKALAWKLSGCQRIADIETPLVCEITEHFYEKDVSLCPEIRSFCGDLYDFQFPINLPISRFFDCVARIFPEAWFRNINIISEDFAGSLSPIAHRIKSAQLQFDQGWTFEEAPVVFSNMACLEELTICGVLAEEYREYFSFLPKLKQLEELEFRMYSDCTGWCCLLGMFAPRTPLWKLSIDCKSLPDDFHTHFKALAASGVQLSVLEINQESNDLIGVSILMPILETMPSIERLFLWSWADDDFQFVSRTLVNLEHLGISPLKLSQLMALAEERIESGKVLPTLCVHFDKSSSVGLAQRKRLKLAGMVLW